MTLGQIVLVVAGVVMVMAIGGIVMALMEAGKPVAASVPWWAALVGGLAFTMFAMGMFLFRSLALWLMRS